MQQRAREDLGVTPLTWQENFVKLIYKKNEATKIKNYRPISLLNTIFKIWESILYEKTKKPDKPEKDYPHCTIRIPTRKRGNKRNSSDKLNAGKQLKRNTIHCHDRPIQGLQQ